MPQFDPALLVLTLAVAGMVLVLASLTSGLVERIAIPSVAVFLVLGLLLGPHGLELIDFGLTSPALATVSILSLVLVLFTDAVGVDRAGIRQHFMLAVLVLGPGTLCVAILTAAAAWLFLGVGPAEAAILGAALASTDPVMMRGLLRRPGVPAGARIALGVESGLNDVVVLPIVLVAMAFLTKGGATAGSVGVVALDVFLLGPVAGVAVGFLAVRLLEVMRARFGLRRDYESLYVLGVAFTAFAAAEAVHASGFMAAFAAGLTVNLLDAELCDCFHDYGEATSEMFLLFAFVAFGASLIWTGLEVLSWQALAFAAVALFIRTVVLSLVLPRRLVDPASRRLLVWFGPRALSSLLLVLLPVFAGLEGAAALFPVTALVVLLSVLVHGGMLAFSGRRRSGGGPPVPVVPPPAEAARPGEEAALVADPILVTPGELDRLIAAEAPVRVVDVRTEGSWGADDLIARGAVRLPPDRPADNAAALALPRQDWLVGYCA